MTDPAAKSTLRSAMRNLLGNVPAHQLSAASTSICQHIAGCHDLLHDVATIAVYAALEHEVSLSSLHELLPGMRLVYPRCQPGQQLAFHLVSHPAELTPGTNGILEPVPAIHREVGLAGIDLILCPGLAYAPDGSRLGRGSGYYDRALEAFTGRMCGIAMSRQIMPSVPRDDHDVLMDYLASETGVQATRLR